MSVYARDYLERLRSSVDLRELAAEYTVLKGSYERSGPCPVCEGYDRFHAQPGMFFCRQCRPYQAGKRQDVFDFLVWVGQATTFQDAVRFLEDWLGSPRTEPPPRQQAQISEDWKQKAQWFVGKSKSRLLAGGLTDGQMYLSNRGLDMKTWGAHHLGETLINGVSAIVIPWYEQGGITAVQMRFTKLVDNRRYQRWGANGYYGRPTLYRTRRKITDTLVITEGEISALSVWQATTFNAVSVGSQNFPTLTEEAIRQASDSYKRILIWTDEVPVAERIAAIVGSKARLVQADMDANDCLVKGTLCKVLS